MLARALRRLGSLCLVLTLWSAAAPCAAQEAEDEGTTARARQLFAEGLELADGGDWERAVQRFRRALDLREAAPVRFNLATSLANMGRLVEALAELNAVLSDPEADEAVRASATALRDELRPRLGGLVVEVQGDIEDAHVTVDGRPWEAVGDAAPADPGIRVVRLLREMTELDIEEADVVSGEVARVTLEMPGVPESEPGSVMDGAAPAAEGGDDGWIWGIAVGAVMVAIGAAVVTGVVLMDQGPATTMGDFMPPTLEIGP